MNSEMTNKSSLAKNQKKRLPGLIAAWLLILGACASAAVEEIPVAKFTDITPESGITFTHVNGAYGDKLLPETMGGGVAFFDFDNNGHQDLLFINSSYWPSHVPSG